MATITWTGAAGDGNFNNPANWSPTQVPGSADTVVISPSAAVSITATNDTVGALTTSKVVSLHISNNSTFGIGDGSASTTFSNAGTLNIDSGGNSTGLRINDTKVTLTGGGKIVLSDNGANYIQGASVSDTLINLNNTISGAGQIGAGQLTLVNHATINGNDDIALLINTGSTVVNSGLIESTGTGGLYVQTAIDSSTGGTILAAGQNLYVQNTLIGGTVSSSGTGSVVTQNATLDGSGQAVSNLGSIFVQNNTNLTLDGTISNHGNILLSSGGNATNLIAGSASVILNGGGTVTTTDSGANQIYGASAANILDNVDNVISGAGNFGAGQLSFVNETAGVLNASLTTALTVNTNHFTNSGLVEATGTGGLTLDSAIDNGTVGRVVAAGGNVNINGGTIIGGTLSTTGGAGFFINNATFDGSTNAITNLGTVQVDNNNSLSLLGKFINQGKIVLASGGNATNLIAGTATLTLTGGGTIVTSDSSANQIYGATGADVLDNINNTITGAGNFGAGQLTFINETAGILNASLTNALVINTSGGFTNKGLVEATNTGGLVLQSTINNGTAGRIAAAGGNISVNSGTIAGGTLSVTGTSGFFTNNATFDGSTNALTNLGRVTVDNNTSLYLLGTIVNKGTITLSSGGNSTNLIANSPTLTLTGGGHVLTSDSGANQIYGSANANVLDNVDNTIAGAGNFGAGQLTFINETAGILDASLTNALIINTPGGFTNRGLVESTGSGGLVLQSVIDNGTAGRVVAAGGNISLNGGTIAGGKLSSSGGAIVFSNGGTLDGSAHTLNTSASVQVNNNTSLHLRGTIANSGNITLASGGNATDLIVDSTTLTLTGGGTITMTDNGANRIYGSAAANVLDNVNNTIQGAGQLGAGQLTLTNSGTINANASNALIINLGSSGTNTASGQMLASGIGGLIFQNGSYSNSGLIQANDGSSVTFQSGASLTNDSATGTLVGGTYAAIANGHGATFTDMTNVAVAALKANLILSGAGSEISFGGATIETSLKNILAGGELQVLGARGYTSKAHLTDSGTIALAGGLFKTGGLTEKSTGVISGFGTISSKLADTGGGIVATGGTLDLSGKGNTISGTLSGTGTLAFGGTDTLNAGTVLDVSTISLINAATLDLATNLSFAGHFNIISGGSLGGTGTFTNTGVFAAGAKAVATVSDPFSNSGTVSVTAGGSLSFTGGLANTGLILDSGVFRDTAALTGGSLTVGSAGAATLASLAGAGNSTLNTLTLNGGTLNTSGTTLTVTGDYVNTATGTGNSYNPFANVSGTIDGQGTKLAVAGVNGTTITSVNGTLTIAIKAGGTASFVIENTGAAGSAALRGALETTVNGGTINGTKLTGTGVTAGNFGPIAAGSSSGTYTIHYSSGTLANEAIHLASDFANVAGLTIDIVAQTGNAAGVMASPPTEHGLALPSLDNGLAWHPILHG